jgi:hypothetical protein
MPQDKMSSGINIPKKKKISWVQKRIRQNCIWKHYKGLLPVTIGILQDEYWLKWMCKPWSYIVELRVWIINDKLLLIFK